MNFPQLPWWAWVSLYIIASAFFGGINNQIQYRRCHKETRCGVWTEDICSHLSGSIVGYIAWPVVLPASVLYELARGTTFQRLHQHNEQRRQAKSNGNNETLIFEERKNGVIAKRNQLLAEQARLEGILPGNRDHRGRPIDS